MRSLITIITALFLLECSTKKQEPETFSVYNQEEWTSDFEFETTDKEADKITLAVSVRYRIESKIEEKLHKAYGTLYPDKVLLPVVSAIAKNVLKNYSAGEIYNYKRDEVVKNLREQTKTAIAQYGFMLTDYILRSVKLPDAVRDRVLQEHLERWEAPYSLPAPKDWGVERFWVPPSFAPSISYRGVEDIRFAPGWAKQTSAEYWSYAFLWYLESKPELTEASMERDLKAYYTGLLNVNSDSAKLAAEPPITVQAKFKMTQATKHGHLTFIGSVTMRDYMTRKPITLNCIVQSKPCTETGKEPVFFQLSPQPFEHSVWKSLGQLWQDFRCKK